MSAFPANGNGVGTMSQLNTYVRTLMRGENVLTPESVSLMQHDTSTDNPSYGLGCHQWQYLGYGHKGDHRGYSATMAYNPETGVSIVVMLPLWDERSLENFTACQMTLFNAAFETLKVLGYPAETLHTESKKALFFGTAGFTGTIVGINSDGIFLAGLHSQTGSPYSA